jgi:murein biosynthesis integral membrane protein MurJ
MERHRYHDADSDGMPLTALAPAALALIGLSCVVKLLGFGEKQLIAYKFGAGSEVDAWFVALSVAMILFLLTRELLEPAYLPVFMRRLAQGRPRSSWQVFAFAAAAILCLVTLVAGVIYASADGLASALGPGFSSESAAQCAHLIRASLFAGVPLALSTLTYITLNGYKRFVAPALGDVALRSAIILCILLLAADFGVSALAIGLVLGAAARLAVHISALRRQLRLLSWPSRESAEDIRTLTLLMAPLAAGVVFAQASDLAANYFASLAGPGAVAARTFARKIVDLPLLLVPYALSVVAFPHFVTLTVRGEWDRLYRLLGDILLSLALAFSALGIIIAILAEPIVAILFERGAFDATATQRTAWILTCYAVGLVAFALEALLVPFYFSLSDTRTPVLVGIVGVLLDIALAAWLVGYWGAAGVAAALTIAKSLKVAALALLLRRKRQAPSLVPIGWAILRIGTASALSAGGGLLLTTLWSAPTSLAGRFAYCALAACVCCAIHLAALALMRGAEWCLVVDCYSYARRFRKRVSLQR